MVNATQIQGVARALDDCSVRCYTVPVNTETNADPGRSLRSIGITQRHEAVRDQIVSWVKERRRPPSRRELATACGISPTRAQQIVALLAAAGRIELDDRGFVLIDSVTESP